MDPDSKRLSIGVTDGRGRSIRAAGLTRWLARVAPARARGEVAIALASDAQVRALNRRYRRKDQPTDVLSFPGDASVGSPPANGRWSTRSSSGRGSSSGRLPQLGDIVIATGVARRQAREAGHAYHTELRVLALHGLLHLLGYDHDAPDDGGRMARFEARLRRAGGLAEGLIERRAESRRRAER